MNIQKMRLLILAFLVGLLCAGCTAKTSAQDTEKPIADVQASAITDANSVADPSEMASRIPVVEEGMKPIAGSEIKDGIYSIAVSSSSSMFHITSCELIVKNGTMRAVMTMGGTGYRKLYMGTGEEAVKAEEKEYITYVQTEEGTHTFEVPVEALDKGIHCSAFSKKKEKWYDRILVFRSDSLPLDAFVTKRITAADSLHLADGIYTAEVILEGGSGRASVETPAALRVENGIVFATIIWGSANYDYMKVDNEKYTWAGTGENSTFEIPISVFDWKIPVVANTIAMSEPHEIAYTLTFDSTTLKKVE